MVWCKLLTSSKTASVSVLSRSGCHQFSHHRTCLVVTHVWRHAPLPLPAKDRALLCCRRALPDMEDCPKKINL